MPLNQRGFSLIELVVIILILGIVSATVAPKFFNSDNLTEYTYRSDIIAKLRLIQTRAMQQTDGSLGYCHRVLIEGDRLGVPRSDCDNTPSFDATWQATSTDVVVESSDSISFSTTATNNTFTFDSFGRPVNCHANTCTITVTGKQPLIIMIEKEGYIHAG